LCPLFTSGPAWAKPWDTVGGSEEDPFIAHLTYLARQVDSEEEDSSSSKYFKLTADDLADNLIKEDLPFFDTFNGNTRKISFYIASPSGVR
jgi:hypothetical protein